MRPVLVIGATGFVGQHLCDALERRGIPLRAATRDPERARKRWPSREWVQADVEDPATLQPALEGCRALVYLVHQMGAHEGDLEAAERASARAVREAAEAAGLERIVYLGGPRPSGEVSAHLAARLATGEELRAGSISTIELRAAMIVGHGSASWLIVRDLALRLPVMVLPRWLRSRSQPIGIQDIVHGLVASLELDEPGSVAFDLPGPETLSAEQILMRVARHRGMRPRTIGVPLLTPRLSCHWIRLVTRADPTIAAQLVEGLTDDLIASGPSLWDRIGHTPQPFDEAVAEALAAESAPDAPVERFWERVALRVAASP